MMMMMIMTIVGIMEAPGSPGLWLHDNGTIGGKI